MIHFEDDGHNQNYDHGNDNISLLLTLQIAFKQ
jgi:hypothetical protein